MIEKLISEINKALDMGLYLVAIEAALTLPDICGKAEYSDIYPNNQNKARYEKWYSENVKDVDLPADVVYKLRCSLLHQGDIMPNCGDNIRFKLQTNSFTEPLGISFCISSSIVHADGTAEQVYDVYVGYLCGAICQATRSYYERNKEKFGFLNMEIVDIKDMF